MRSLHVTFAVALGITAAGFIATPLAYSNPVATSPQPPSFAVPARYAVLEAKGVQCPCSGTKLCVGPRGGRYCITSGGKKRYTH